jgi:hypothetical protein
MLKFPVVPSDIEPPPPKMSLLEYAHFSERCLHSNPSISAQNCMSRRADERFMKPFRIPGRRDVSAGAT